MSSGTGVYGQTGQCYRFWLGFTECRRDSPDPRLCVLERADYMECVHREGLKKRIAEKALQVEKINASAAPAAAHH